MRKLEVKFLGELVSVWLGCYSLGFRTLSVRARQGAIVVTSEEKENNSNLFLSRFFFLQLSARWRRRLTLDCCRIQTMDLIYCSILLLPENKIFIYLIIELNKITVNEKSNTKTNKPLNSLPVQSPCILKLKVSLLVLNKIIIILVVFKHYLHQGHRGGVTQLKNHRFVPLCSKSVSQKS